MLKVGRLSLVWTMSVWILCPGASVASSFFFSPEKGKITTYFPEQDQPKWLKVGNGDDGYVRVDAVVDMPGRGCVKLGSANPFKTEALQVSTSLSISGIRNSLSDQEISLITADGRSNPGDCALISTLPMTVVSMALLEPYNRTSPGNITFLVRARSTSDSNINLVGTAQTLLGVASVFTTGGAASTLSTLTSNFAAPALSQAQKKFEEVTKTIDPEEARIELDWKTLRGGVKQIDIPFYSGETKLFESVSDAKMRLKSQSATLDGPAYVVRLKFSFFRSIFDARTTGPSELPNGATATLSSKRVISYPRIDGIPNLLQAIATDSSTFMQALASANTSAAWTVACDKGLEALRAKGLNYIDRGVAIKAFVDEATNGNGWAGPSALPSCFANDHEALEAVKEIFGDAVAPRREFSSLDIQVDDGLPSYKQWLKVASSLIDLQSAMTAAGGREPLITRLTGGNDINFTVVSGMWVDPQTLVQATPSSSGQSSSTNVPLSNALPGENGPNQKPVVDSLHPNIQLLATRRAKAVGCFIRNPNKLVSVTSAMFLIATEDSELWLADSELVEKGQAIYIRDLTLKKLDMSWRQYFVGMAKMNWFPASSQGDCRALIAML